MSKLINVSAVVLFLLLLSFNSFAQTRAAENDTVWVVLNHVKPDKTDQFEKFVHEIFWPGADKLSLEEQEAFKLTRVLHPVKPEEDGTFTYMFIMDPASSSRNYDIEDLLVKQYGEDQGKEYYKLFKESLDGEQEGYVVVQR